MEVNLVDSLHHKRQFIHQTFGILTDGTMTEEAETSMEDISQLYDENRRKLHIIAEIKEHY